MPCGSTGVTCAKSVVVVLDGHTVTLMKGGAVNLNGEDITLPHVIKEPGKLIIGGYFDQI